MIINRSINTECDTLEPPESEQKDDRDTTKDDGLHFERKSPWGEYKVVKDMRQHKDGEI